MTHEPPAGVPRRGLLLGAGAALGLGMIGSGVRLLVADQPRPTVVGAAVRPPSSPTEIGTSSPVSPAAPTPRPVEPVVVEAPGLTERLTRYLDERGGTLGLELVDLDRGQIFRYRADEGLCYSTIKVLILTTVLRLGQEDGTQLTDRQRDLAERMITRSDNAATEALLAQVGRGEVRRVAGLAGMTRTEIDAGWWGHWRTVPGDLDRMVDAVLDSDAVLDGGRRTIARFMMSEVVAAQRWGVFAPESDDVYVAAKNGWGPMPAGYHLNSTGWVSGGGREYVLGILSVSPSGFRYGRQTISRVAGICHDALASPLA
ncbi:MAG: serine hydrolase [Dermatophilaceae bacterium]